ncbi:ABC-type Fe3+-hydroxamate transport system substrate-binding protein [Pedobacter sp. CAN_A7]|uniref:ABC transporter substrate-binding protein n=1 Tax=Pedobacter sp. CAN_A7 TaxID=2787722 RepID=UPI0018C95D39
MRRTFRDQLNREVQIDYPPKRVISLVPSQTELLFELGLNQEIIGLTKFCIHPAGQVKGKTTIGGTKNLNLDLIRSLKPDLIIGNKEENQQHQIEELMQEFPVWMSDVNNLNDAKKAIEHIGELVNRAPEAAYLNHLINAGFNDLQNLALQHHIRRSAVYLIWRGPYMAAGKGTFIDHMMALNGIHNAVTTTRYPELTLTAIADLRPDLILLSSEPYPFSEKHIQVIHEVLPLTEVRLVDGEMFSWYGSRLVKAVQYFFQLQKEL